MATINGTSGNDILFGTPGDDQINGGAGADTMSGGLGNDTYTVDNVGDVVIENPGEGTDTIITSANYALPANVENLTAQFINPAGGGFTLTGNALDNTITGSGFQDTIDGGIGADTMIGGIGNDTYIVDNVGDVVVENVNEGSDTVKASVSYSLSSNVENLILIAAGTTGTGNSLANTFTANAANQTLIGGAGDDIYIVSAASTGATIVENPGEGVDTVQSSVNFTLSANVENLTLTGTASINGTGNELDNLIIGNSGANTLIGGDGNDTLNGLTGADTMIGGAGNDTYFVDFSGDVVIENPGEGVDTVQSSISYTLTANVENLTLTSTLTSGTNGTGNELDNIIIGNSGNNILNGLAGADTMIGGAGNDAYVVDNAGDVVVENANEGTDTVQTSINYTLGANVENLTLIAAGLTGTGNSLNNQFSIQFNNETLIGGTGDDTYVIGAGVTGTIIVENPGEGTDTVQSASTYTLGANIESLTLTGTAAIDGTGNALDNVITGNSAANTLIGGDGNDKLDGGAGADILIGGTGNDTYVVDNAGDVVVENSGEGIDTVISSLRTYTMPDNVENDIVVRNDSLTGPIGFSTFGNALDNTITGWAGSDFMDGGAGADTLIGGGGDDIYRIDALDTIVELPGGGNDTVQAAFNYTLGANLEDLTLLGAGLTGTGNSLDNQFNIEYNNQTLIGGAGNDTYDIFSGITGTVIVENPGEGIDTINSNITYTLPDNVENLSLFGSASYAIGNALDNVLKGNDLNNALTGGAGNDTLDGGAGADLMVGGTGNDIYYVDSAGDIVIENPGEGTDSVFSTVTYTLGANIENLTLTGTASINGTGNALDNILVGTSGNNVLNGGSGADSMTGGSGNDTYYVDNVGDVVVENLNGGTDTVVSSISYVLGANVENLTLNHANTTGTGNALANILTANALNETLAGGAGNDTYIINSTAGGFVIVENANEGTDTVQSAFSYTLGANLENLTLTGTANLIGTGNSLDNTITGNSGNNTLSGGAGNDSLFGGAGADTMKGGAGDDTYWVDNAGDVVVENSGEGTDTINSTISYTLGANVENLSGSGSTALTLIGNTLNNVITGGSGNDIINGGDGNDTLNGLNGNDTLIGGAGNDTFAIWVSGGHDIIQDFTPTGISADRIDLTAFHFASFAAVMAVTSDVSGSAMIHLNSGTDVTLQGVTASQLTSSDFLI